MIVLQIHSTARDSQKDPWVGFDNTEEEFSKMKDVEPWLKDKYENATKSKIYVDIKKGKATNSRHVGWIYAFKNKDWSHNSPE